MQVRGDGQPLREAVKKAGLSTRQIAEKTKAIDGYGVSQSLVGALLATGTSRRRNCRKRSADLIAEALGIPVENLFLP